MKITKREIFIKTKEQLLKYGYDHLTFTTLAQDLAVTRAALYKYYDNKDELIIDLMIEEMAQFLNELEVIRNNKNETDLLQTILLKMIQFSDLHHLLESVFRIDYETQEKFRDKMVELQRSHILFNQYLNEIIEECKKSGILTKKLDNSFLISFLSNIVNVLDNSNDQKKLERLEYVLMHGIGTED